MLVKLKQVLKQRLLGRFLMKCYGKDPVNFIDVGSVGKLPHPRKNNPQFIRNLLKFEPRDEARNLRHVVTISTALWEENVERFSAIDCSSPMSA